LGAPAARSEAWVVATNSGAAARKRRRFIMGRDEVLPKALHPARKSNRKPKAQPTDRRLTRVSRSETSSLSPITMGQQLNKYIKRKRRAAYLKRKNARTKAAAKKK
jgi:hypothetical protein